MFTIMETDGMKLRKLRKRRAMSQDELAEASGVGRATISRAERGESDSHGKTIRALAAALGVPVEDLMTEELAS